MSRREVLLGIDVGGSSIKAGLVDVHDGMVVGETASVPTPRPSTPQALLEVFVELDRRFGSRGPVGLAIPSVVTRGVARTAANIDRSWIGTDAGSMLRERLGRPVVLLNDADAAGLAEMRWGAGRATTGTVIMLTFGTGIGSAIFVDGALVPNTEFGHMELDGREAETWASARVKTEENLDWEAWAARVDVYLSRMHALLWPDVFILGGAVSAEFERFGPLLKAPAEIRPAQFAGQAGVAGAALAAANLAP